MEKRLGKIEDVYFGLGGYQGVMIEINKTYNEDCLITLSKVKTN